MATSDWNRRRPRWLEVVRVWKLVRESTMVSKKALKKAEPKSALTKVKEKLKELMEEKKRNRAQKKALKKSVRTSVEEALEYIAESNGDMDIVHLATLELRHLLQKLK